MIAITTNSLNSNSRLPPLPNSVECSFLEKLTGADMLISIAPYPIRTEALLLKHIEAGALLVQHKSEMDLIASLGERLDSEQARMSTIATRKEQRVLLSTGLYGANRNGELTLNGVPMGVKWIQYQGAISKWGKRGGWHENLPSDEHIPQWCELQLKHLNEMSGKGVVKQVYQRAQMAPQLPPLNANGEFDDPLQLLIPVNDARNLLLSLPDCGPSTAEWLWEVSGHNAWLALQIATHSEWYKSLPGKPRSFGPAFIGKAQKYLGVVDYPNSLDTLKVMLGEKSTDAEQAND